jgi:5'-nucleotidase
MAGSLHGNTFHQQYRDDNVQIMNALGYDAMNFNHEFDDGNEVLAAFIDGLNFPVVATNVDFSESEILAQSSTLCSVGHKR